MEGQIRGPIHGGQGTPTPFTASVSGSSRVNDAHARLMDALLSGRLYYMSVAAAAGTAYVGAAGGTPLLAAHNPAGSGKVLVPLFASVGLRAAATAAGQTALALWAGVSVLPTGTQTAPRNALSQAQGGSAAQGFSNTALTGSTALNLAAALLSHYWATAAAAFASPGLFDLAGLGAAIPGNQFALGLTVIPTSLTVDASLWWEEVPYQTTT